MKKETKTKLLSVLKFVGTLLVETLWALLVFAFGFCVGADKFADLRSSSVIRASAESVSAAEVSTVAEEMESGFDLSQYPSVNLIPYPFDNDNSNRLFYVGDEYTLRGVTCRFNIDGSISLFGTSSESFTFIFVSYKQFSLPVGVNYCISGGKDNVTINCWKRDVNGASVVFASSANGNVNYGCINDGESFYRIGLSFKNGYVYNTTIYPMLNVGEVAYPYSPSFDLIYNQGYQHGSLEGYDNGYNNGYAAGESVGREEGYPSGYQDGYDEGLAFSKHGIFQHLTFEVTMRSSDGAFIERSFGLLGPNSVSFGNVYEELVSLYRNDYYFDLLITVGHGYENELPMSLINGAIIGTSDALAFYSKGNSFSVYGSNYFVDAFYQYTGYFEQLDIDDGLSFTDYSLPYYMLKFEQGTPDPDLSNIGFSSMTLRFDDLDVFKKLSFAYTDGYYNQGYNTGYNVGYDKGIHAGHGSGYDQGYAVGKTEGKEIGFEEGNKVGYDKGLFEGEEIGFQKGFNSAGNGGFGWLINSVQAFLDTDFFGSFSIGDLVYVMVGVSLVLLFLKFFSK